MYKLLGQQIGTYCIKLLNFFIFDTKFKILKIITTEVFFPVCNDLCLHMDRENCKILGASFNFGVYAMS